MNDTFFIRILSPTNILIRSNDLQESIYVKSLSDIPKGIKTLVDMVAQLKEDNEDA